MWSNWSSHSLQCLVTFCHHRVAKMVFACGERELFRCNLLATFQHAIVLSKVTMGYLTSLWPIRNFVTGSLYFLTPLHSFCPPRPSSPLATTPLLPGSMGVVLYCFVLTWFACLPVLLSLIPYLGGIKWYLLDLANALKESCHKCQDSIFSYGWVIFQYISHIFFSHSFPNRHWVVSILGLL